MAVEIYGGATQREQRGDTVLPGPEEKPARDLFNAIAPRYDLLNSVLSARLHHGRRRVAAREADLKPGGTALDVYAGTCAPFELTRFTGPAGRVIATDVSAPMRRAGANKRAKRGGQNTQSAWLSLADTQAPPFSGNSFDAVTVGLGRRNVANREAALREKMRAAKPGGRGVVLEFSQPRDPVFRTLYRADFFKTPSFQEGAAHRSIRRRLLRRFTAATRLRTVWGA